MKYLLISVGFARGKCRTLGDLLKGSVDSVNCRGSESILATRLRSGTATSRCAWQAVADLSHS